MASSIQQIYCLIDDHKGLVTNISAILSFNTKISYTF